jgi:hypothetical protein
MGVGERPLPCFSTTAVQRPDRQLRVVLGRSPSSRFGYEQAYRICGQLLGGMEVMVSVVDMASEMFEIPDELDQSIGRALRFVPKSLRWHAGATTDQRATSAPPR